MKFPDPLSAVITAEFASTNFRGGIVAAVFAMQGLGQLAAALMALIVVVAYKNDLQTVASVADCSGDCSKSVDMMWRLLIAFGGIPGWFALYYRLTIPETPRYTFDVLYDVEKASVDAHKYRYGKRGNAIDPITQAQSRRDMLKYRTPRPTPGEIFRYYTDKWNALKLFGTAFSWFFLDLAFYGLNFSSPLLLSTMGFDRKGNLYQDLKNTATGQLVLICAGAIPGYWMTVFTVDKIGRKPIQIGGFAILTIIFCVLGFAWHNLGKVHLLVLYVLAQFFFNFGTMLYLVLALLSIDLIRTQCHHIHQPSGDIPNSRPFDRSWRLRGPGEIRSCDCSNIFRADDQEGCHPRQSYSVDTWCHANICTVHVSRYIDQHACTGGQKSETRGVGWREG